MRSCLVNELSTLESGNHMASWYHETFCVGFFVAVCVQLHLWEAIGKGSCYDYFLMDHFSLTHCKMCLSLASKNSVSGPFICHSPYEVFPTLCSRFNVQGLFVSVSFLIGLDYAKLRLKVFLRFSW